MVEQECVGAIVCKLDMHKKMFRRGYIAMLAVDSQHRRKSIGKATPPTATTPTSTITVNIVLVLVWISLQIVQHTFWMIFAPHMSCMCAACLL